MMSREEYIRFNNEPSTEKCLEIVTSAWRAVTDQQAREIIEKYAKCRTIAEFQSMDDKKQERCIKKIYEKGVSVRQASRLTGISKGKVEKWLKT